MLLGKTIKEVEIARSRRPKKGEEANMYGGWLQEWVPYDMEEPSGGERVRLCFTDGTYAYLVCCSCCDGLGIDG